jgi:integrase
VVETLKDLQGRTTRQFGNSGADAAELCFITPTGRHIKGDKLAKRFKAILRQVGLRVIRLYDLRHTAATLALSAGVPPKVVAEQLGHASAAFTLDVYSHLLPHVQAEAAERVKVLLYLNSGPVMKTTSPNQRKPAKSSRLQKPLVQRVREITFESEGTL